MNINDEINASYRAMTDAFQKMGVLRSKIEAVLTQLKSAVGDDRIELIRQQMDLEKDWDELYRQYHRAQFEYQQHVSKSKLPPSN